MNEPCPLCKVGILHRAKMKFKNGEEGTFMFCENCECDFKERRNDNEQDKPGPVQAVSLVLAN